MSPTLVIGIALVVMAAALGSFINVVALRLPLIRLCAMEQGKRVSLSHPDSRCPRCHSRIPWYLNVPVIGWLVIRGRCARCNTRIPTLYPLGEAAATMLALMAIWRLGGTWEAALLSALLLSLYAISRCTEDGLTPLRRTASIRWTLSLLPLLFAIAPWGLSRPIGVSLPAQPDGLMVSAIAVGLAELALVKRRPLRLLDVPVLAACFLVFTPAVGAIAWLAVRASTRYCPRPDGVAMAGPRMATLALLLALIAVLFPAAGQVLLTPPWGTWVHP